MLTSFRLRFLKFFLGPLFIASLYSCGDSNEELKKEISKILANNPELITEIITSHPLQFSEVIEKAMTSSKDILAQQRRESEERDFFHNFRNPLAPKVSADDVIRGSPNAELTLVEYVDFECPFCARGYQTVKELERRYQGRIRVIMKHLPLSFHDKAMPAARYYEALRLQDDNYAIAFYHRVFQEQQRLEHSDIFLREIAQEIGANMNILKDDLINNTSIEARIKQDMQEAQRFGIRGTPGFILGGIPIRGAYPVDYFERVISELQKREMTRFAKQAQ